MVIYFIYVYDDYIDKSNRRFREVILDDYFEEKHDILIANIGDVPLSGLKVKLDATNVKLDDYWKPSSNLTFIFTNDFFVVTLVEVESREAIQKLIDTINTIENVTDI